MSVSRHWLNILSFTELYDEFHSCEAEEQSAMFLCYMIESQITWRKMLLGFFIYTALIFILDILLNGYSLGLGSQVAGGALFCATERFGFLKRCAAYSEACQRCQNSFL